MSDAPIRIVIADDHPIVLEGLVQLFGLEPDLDVVARCTTGDETLDAVRRLQPSVLVLDVRMPGKDGIAVLRALAEEHLPTRVVLLTAALNEGEVLEAVRLGVRGVVLKEAAPSVLVECIRKVHAGESWVDNRTAVRALAHVARRDPSVPPLTPREREIAGLVAGGLRNKEIASRVGITEGTVKLHLHNIYEKLKIDGRLALMLHVNTKGLA